VQLERNGGFAHGCNVGWRLGRSPAVLFLNPDARIDAGSVASLAQVLVDDPRVGVAGPKILDSTGALDYSMRRFPRLPSTYAQAFFLHRVFPRALWVDEVVRDDSTYEMQRDPEWISGACILVRRTLLDTLNGFDEGFFMYCEDKDLCRRAWDAGFTVRYAPVAVAVHVGGVSAPRSELLPVLAASRIRYACKHAYGWRASAERLGVALGSVTHSAVGRGGVRRGHARAFARALRSP
jgi:GT2 family glycosyltransferase